MNETPRSNPVRAALAEQSFIVAPGVYDLMSALMAQRAGFDFIYASGYWLSASAYGLPDAGLVSYTQMLDRVSTIGRTVGAGLIADADTGFGGLLNVHHTVRGYEAAGVAAIQIEDQVFPKKCGHTPNKRVVSTQEMVDKIGVACEARSGADGIVIIARTDARQAEGTDAAIARGQAYADAGADIVFVEALYTEEELSAASAAIAAPLMANMAHGGQTPILTPARLGELGYAAAIYPALAPLAAMKAVEQVYGDLRNGLLPDDDSIFSFAAFNRVIGFEAVWALEDRWASAGRSAS